MEGRQLKYKEPHKGVEMLAHRLLRETDDTDALVYNPNLSSEADLYAFVKERKFDVIGVSVLQTVLKKNLEIMGQLSLLAPDAVIVAGGNELRGFPLNDVFNSWPVDALFFDGSTGLVDYIRSFVPSQGRDKNVAAAKTIPNVALRTPLGFEMTRNEREQMVSLADVNEDVPFDKPDVVHHDRYDRTDDKTKQPIAFDRIGRNPFRVQLGNFCRGRCIFCGTKRNTQRDLAPQQVVKIIKDSKLKVQATDLGDSDLVQPVLSSKSNNSTIWLNSSPSRVQRIARHWFLL